MVSDHNGLDFVIHCGDVIDKGKVAEYSTFDTLRSRLFPTTPWYYAPGNHDKPSARYQVVRVGESGSWSIKTRNVDVSLSLLK